MINAIDLAKLRNGEFLQFGTNFSEVVESNNPKGLNVAAQHAVFKTKVAETAGLFNVERASAVTQELILIDERRDKAINGLTLVIQGYCCHFDPSLAGAANLLASNLQLFGIGMARQNFQAETASITGIMNDWESKPELTAALETLALTKWKEELKTANELFDKKYIERTKEYSAANPDTLKSKREETMVAYYDLRKFLGAYAVIQSTPEYQKTIKELNALIDQYNTLLNGRLKGAPAPAPATN